MVTSPQNNSDSGLRGMDKSTCWASVPILASRCAFYPPVPEILHSCVMCPSSPRRNVQQLGCRVGEQQRAGRHWTYPPNTRY